MNTSKALLTWYDCNRRELPWRHTRDPYAIWVSEIMLQQTQVATVIGYYQRWMITFPTITTLAEANLDQVLALWQGLGYYSRARSLHHAAGIIKDELGNVIPHTAAALRKLPGIGAYTSAAIASIAFGEPIAVVDGNVIRVLSRLYDLSDDVTRAATKNKIARLAQELLNNERPGDFNQAMMELGATICTPHSPLCDVCPLAEQCLALEHGTIEDRPVKPARVKPPHHHLAAAFCIMDDRLLLVRRIPKGLLGGLWEVPNSEPLAGESDQSSVERLLQTDLKLQSQAEPRAAHIRHAYTHFTVDVAVLPCTISGTPSPDTSWDKAVFVAADDLAQYGLTGVTRRILQAIGWPYRG